MCTHIWGPYQDTSLRGNRYFISVIDDYSRKSWVEFLNPRSGAFEALKQCTDRLTVVNTVIEDRASRNAGAESGLI